MVFARDGRTLFFRSGRNLFAATLPNQQGGAGAAAQNAAPAGGGRGGGGGRRGRGGATEPSDLSTPATTARQVTYTVNLEIDRKAVRSQVFNEGWRIMKNRFYDAKMHGADWVAVKKMYEPLLEFVDDEELHTVMMMMIGQLNASHTGVSGGPEQHRAQHPDAPPGLRHRRRRRRLVQGRPRLQGWAGRS